MLDDEKNFEKRSPKNLSDILSDKSNNIINWGNHIFNNDSLFKLNSSKAIALASNKRLSRRILQEAGVAVPHTYFEIDWYEAPQWKYPIIARPAFHHAGKHFFVLNFFGDLIKIAHENTLNDFGNWYLSEVFPKTHEYRVHVAHGKILMISDKPLLEGEIRGNQAVTEESWRALKWSEFNPKICQESIKAVEELGLDYGAVDIMYNAHDDSVAICEVNTSPSIATDYSSGKYAKYFDWCIRHSFPPHFPLDGTTAVFYNKLLEA